MSQGEKRYGHHTNEAIEETKAPEENRHQGNRTKEEPQDKEQGAPEQARTRRLYKGEGAVIAPVVLVHAVSVKRLRY